MMIDFFYQPFLSGVEEEKKEERENKKKGEKKRYATYE